MPEVLAIGFLALCIRTIVFVLTIGFFPYFITPVAIRIALSVVIIVSCLPVFLGTSYSFGDLLISLSQSVSLMSYPVLLSEVAIGLLLGVSISVAAYVAEIIAAWISSLMFEASAETDYAELSLSSFRNYRAYHSVRALLVLMLWYILFHTSSVFVIWRVFADNVFLFPINAPLAIIENFEFSRIIELGSLSLKIALLFLVPLIAVSLFVDCLWLLYVRWCQKTRDLGGLVQASKMSVLVLTVALSVYYYSARFDQLLGDTLSTDHSNKVMSELKK